MIYNNKCCNLCPRNCNADRTLKNGFCGAGEKMNISKIMLHHWEEPCISGTDDKRGSGAVFFSGCNLRCCYCQNAKISRQYGGTDYTPPQLAEEIKKLEKIGAYNINFVTPTHYYPYIAETLQIYRPCVPIVYNTGGYEKADTVRELKDCADIFLTDFKYGTNEKAAEYSNAPDYVENALEALVAMVETVGKPVYNEEGLLQKGVIVRHLVLPSSRHDSERALKLIKDAVGSDNVILSLMSQYTPDFAPKNPPLNRRVTTFEYEYVQDVALTLGFNGYSQDKASAKKNFTPNF